MFKCFCVIIQDDFLHEDFQSLVNYAKLATACKEGLLGKMRTCKGRINVFNILSGRTTHSFRVKLQKYSTKQVLLKFLPEVVLI